MHLLGARVRRTFHRRMDHFPRLWQKPDTRRKETVLTANAFRDSLDLGNASEHRPLKILFQHRAHRLGQAQDSTDRKV